MKIKSFFLFLAVFQIFSFNVFSQEKSLAAKRDIDFYIKEHPETYNFAFEKGCELYKKLKADDYKYALEAVSVVFPEMLRYSQFRDSIESLLNEILSYTSEETNGFSIGLFQMKPVFAVQMERIVFRDEELKSKYPEISFEDQDLSSEDRHKRVLRLKDEAFEIIYLKAFVDFEVKNLGLSEMSFDERLKYLSVAYNAGLKYNLEELDLINQRRTFQTEKIALKLSYSKLCKEASEILLLNK